jgi:hypothetical protein
MASYYELWTNHLIHSWILSGFISAGIKKYPPFRKHYLNTISIVQLAKIVHGDQKEITRLIKEVESTRSRQQNWILEKLAALKWHRKVSS